MSTPAGRHRAGALPGMVKVRLSGELPAVDTLAAILAGHPAVNLLTGPDGPYRNHREPGYRVYLTVRVPSDTAEQGAAVHSHPAIGRARREARPPDAGESPS
jgi:hypothetical protein